MLDIISRCYKEDIKTTPWQSKMKVMIPSYGKALNENPDLLKEVRAYTFKTLKLS